MYDKHEIDKVVHDSAAGNGIIDDLLDRDRNPLVPQDNPNPFEPQPDPVDNITIPNRTTRVVSLNYQCPECNGKFHSWDSGFRHEERCPFCHTPKGEYGEDQVTKLQNEIEEKEERIEELEEKLEEIEDAL
jgi:hypothetical protein